MEVFGEWLFNGRILVWFVVMGVFLVVLIGMGWVVAKRPAGILIDSTNHISLSRLQLILWTVLALSAYLMFALIRLANPMQSLTGIPLEECIRDEITATPSLSMSEAHKSCSQIDRLQITFPEELIFAMGISFTSFAGSTLIQSTKKHTDPATLRAAESAVTAARQAKADAEQKATTTGPQLTQAEIDKLDADIAAAEKFKAKIEQEIANKTGVIKQNQTIGEASWLDIFRGNEMTDYQHINLGKVQMFFFTIIVLLAYFFAIWRLLSSDGLLHPLSLDFPPFSDTLNVLFGISHAGYLGVKAVPQS